MQHQPPAETRKPTRRPPKSRDARVGMPEFDRELIRAGQNEAVVVLRLFGGEDEYMNVIIKYVDRYFIKCVSADDNRGRVFWLNKNAIFSAAILDRGNQE